jgi:serine/threonine protein kinase
MIILNKNQLLLKVAARALFAGLEAIPMAGAVIKISYECWRALKEHQDILAVNERIAQLESSATLSPDEARQAADAAIAELEAEGQKIAKDRAETVRDVISVMPAAIRERTKATLHHARKHGTAAATVLPVTAHFQDADREEFYTGLFPQRRPQFQPGDEIPNYNPDWKLERLIGAGGFGEVWLARNQRLKKSPVAVKFCQDSVHAKLMQREADNLVTLMEKLPLGTPHIVGLIDTQLTKQPYWLMFEYISGGTLEHRMRLGAMDLPTAWQLFEPILQGVSQVHEQGIVHRDLKPANILLAGGTDPRIADFGIGKVVAEQKATTRQMSKTFTTMGYGTVNYMSPEQAEGSPADPTDDIYSLGIILYQMLSGRIKPLRYPAELQSLPVPESVIKIIYDCVYFPREKRIPNANALLKRFNNELSITQSKTVATWQQYATESPKHDTSIRVDESNEEFSAFLAEADQVIFEQQQREAELDRQKIQQRAKEQEEELKFKQSIRNASSDFVLVQQQSIEETLAQAQREAKENATRESLKIEQQRENSLQGYEPMFEKSRKLVVWITLVIVGVVYLWLFKSFLQAKYPISSTMLGFTLIAPIILSISFYLFRR